MSASAPIATSIYAYPWDMARYGAEAGVAELARGGFETILLAASYHPIAALSPRDAERQLFYTEAGGVFFPARAKLYGEIKPFVWPDREVVNVWPQVVESAATHDTAISAWTVVGFQPWIGHAYPDTVRVLPTGDRVPAWICIGSAAFREYLANQIADIADQVHPSSVLLEGLGYSSFDYGWVRPRVMVDVAPWPAWLLSLCFCPGCVGAARERGVAVEALRASVVAELRRSLSEDAGHDPRGSVEERKAEYLGATPDAAEFLRVRDETFAETIRLLSRSLKSVIPTASLGLSVPHPGAAFEGLGQPGKELDWIQVVGPAAFENEEKQARQLADATPATHLGRILFAGPHDIHEDDFVHALNRAIQLPVDEISYYNFGLLTPERIAALVPQLRSAEAALNERQ